jgi:hypothetical protein
MDLMPLLRTLRRHKYLVAVVSILTVMGVAYVVFGTPPIYKQSSSIVLIPARPTPSATDLAKDSSLANADAFNPFAGDPNLIVGVVSARLQSTATRESFEERGFDPNYEVAGAVTYGMARPEMSVTAYGSTPEKAIESRVAVAEAVVQELKNVQAEQSVNEYFMLQTVAVEPQGAPEEQTSSMLRSALAVLVLGGILLFAALSVATALDQHREVARARARPHVTSGGEEANMVADGRQSDRTQSGPEVNPENPEAKPHGKPSVRL